MFRASIELYLQEIKYVALVVFGQIAIVIIYDYLDSSSGRTFGELLLWSYLAMAIHNEILLSADRDKKDDFKRIIGFMFRSVGIGILSFLPMFIYAVVHGASTSSENLFTLEFLLILAMFALIGFGVVFASVGTILPAFVYQKGRGFKAAFARGKPQFYGVMARLIFGPGMITILSLLFIFFSHMAFDFNDKVYDHENRNFDYVQAILLSLNFAFQALATVMTAWILCDAYKHNPVPNTNNGTSD